MPAFELNIKSEDLPDTMTAMREWLDHHRFNIAHFHSISDRQGIITLNIGFDVDDHAELFRQRFGAREAALH